MSIGLPGSGIGGVFYLASALIMPMHGGLRSIRQRSLSPLRAVIRQTVLALAIIAALLATGWVLERMIVNMSGSALAFATSGGRSSAETLPRLLRAATVGLTLGTLGGVLLSVQLLRICFAPPRTARYVAPTDDDAGREAA